MYPRNGPDEIPAPPDAGTDSPNGPARAWTRPRPRRCRLKLSRMKRISVFCFADRFHNDENPRPIEIYCVPRNRFRLAGDSYRDLSRDLSGDYPPDNPTTVRAVIRAVVPAAGRATLRRRAACRRRCRGSAAAAGRLTRRCHPPSSSRCAASAAPRPPARSGRPCRTRRRPRPVPCRYRSSTPAAAPRDRSRSGWRPSPAR